MEVKIYNQEGSEVGTVALSDKLFGAEPNPVVVHQYIVNYLANRRQGTASSKGRSDVRGGGAKPYRQKGTGHARRGTERTPLKRGGTPEDVANAVLYFATELGSFITGEIIDINGGAYFG